MRYLPHNPVIRQTMLDKIGLGHIDDLYDGVPIHCLNPNLSELPLHENELGVDQYFQNLCSQNITSQLFFLGGGIYNHHIPSSVDHLIQRGEFLTSYTPYQPEISQGTLQYLFEFQTQVANLFAMDVANASMYDGATATLEAVLMAQRITMRNQVVLQYGLHPHYREVIETSSHFTNFTINQDISHDTACVVLQYPDFFGNIENLQKTADICHSHGALLIVVVTEIISLGLLKPPGEMDADIVVGEGQSLGNSLNFGGPTVGLFSCRDKFVRQMPGRVVGETVDVNGKRSFVLTLSTREQHIRREKATSNICTNAGLCALAFTIHLALLGKIGLQRLAKINHNITKYLVKKIQTIPSLKVLNQHFFNEITIQMPKPVDPIVEKLGRQGIFIGIPLSRFYKNIHENHLLVATTELNTKDHVDQFIEIIKGELA